VRPVSYLFHKEVHLPEMLTKPVYEGRLRYSAHAQAEACNDRYGQIDLPEVFTAANAELIEVEATVQNDRPEVVKQLWRMRLDATRDLVFSVMPNGLVRTVWVNLRSDKHGTLNRARYVSRSSKTCKLFK